jgi:RND family efflux transporter MFP subunit
MPPENELNTMRRALKRAGIFALLLLGAILLIGTLVRLFENHRLEARTEDEEIPTVSLVAPSVGGKNLSQVLPGKLQAFYDAQIYARVPGYVHAWYKDIGTQVNKGELLATIDTPELDQQIAQARADVAAAVSAQKLSAITAQRWNSLLPLDAVSKQDAEEKNEDFAAKTGAARAAQADLDRLLAMKGFARIVAPFDGVVTQRNADVGALVTAGATTSGPPLFAVADVHALRLYVDVPQSYSAQIVPGMKVSFTVPEYSGKTFSAALASTANAISAQSSTLLVEFAVDNHASLLKAGDFAQVALTAPAGARTLRLPASALIFRAAGLQVATLGPDDRVAMKPIQIAADLGTQVVVGLGLGAHDRVIDNPPDSLANGDRVRIGTGHNAD